jgi:hypothetical protein
MGGPHDYWETKSQVEWRAELQDVSFPFLDCVCLLAHNVNSISFGVTPAGHDFEDFCEDFDKNIAESFEAILRARFCE